MGLSDFIVSSVNTTPGVELKNTFGRTENTSLSKGSSFKGRAVCLILIPGHLLGTVAKPIMYAAASATNLIIATACGTAYIFQCIFSNHPNQQVGDAAATSFKKSFRLALCVIVAPVGQAAQVVKAVAAIIHPGAYFKGSAANKPSTTAKPTLPTLNLRPSGSTLNITCDFDTPEKAPTQTLNQLAQAIREDNHLNNISVRYNNNRGADAGGLRRDFMYRLFEAISQELNTKGEIPRWTPEIEEQLRDIGTLFKFVMHEEAGWGVYDEERYATLIGQAFCLETFKQMLTLTHDEVQNDFANISDRRILEIINDLTTEPGPQKDAYMGALAFLDWDGQPQASSTQSIGGSVLSFLGLSQSPVPTKRHTDFIEENYELLTGDEPPVGWINAEGQVDPVIFEEIKETLLKETTAERRKQLQTVHSIAKGMNCTAASWAQKQFSGFQVLEETIQGKFSKAELKRVLTFNYGFSETIRESILNWIDGKSEQELKNLVAAVTGSPSLIGGVTFRMITSGRAVAHTCSRTLDLLVDPSKDDALNLRGILTTLDEYCVAVNADFQAL